MTLWLTVAFLPVAPVRRERLRFLGPEKQRGLPFVFTWQTAPIQAVERLPVDRPRSRRVYGFYYGFFLPLLVAPPVVAPWARPTPCEPRFRGIRRAVTGRGLP